MMSRGNIPPPPPPPGGGGFGRSMLSMVMWGAGITIAFAGVSALFGGRRTQEVHHNAPVASVHPGKPAVKNPALTRPIFNCTLEEDTLRQCLANKGDCKVYQLRVDECLKREAQGRL
jgi:hypothetical protein